MCKPVFRILLTLLTLLFLGRSPLRAGDAKGKSPDTAALEKQMRDAERQLQDAARQLAELHRHDAELSRLDVEKIRRDAERAARDASRQVRIIRKTGSRARLGVRVEDHDDGKGAVIRSVESGSPAAEAGLKAGDIITGVNGSSLTGKSDDDDGPAQRLAALGRDFKSDTPVTVDYLRDGSAHTATVKPRALPGSENRRIILHHRGDDGDDSEIEVPDVPELPDMPELPELPAMPETPHFPHHGFMMMHGRMGGLELTRLEGELGDYFGVHEGLLVLRVPAKSGLPLKAGDVILQAGGKAVKNPHDFFHALHHAKSGETVALEVQRHQRRESLSVKAPVKGLNRDADFDFDFDFEAPDPPEPPEAAEWPEPPEAPAPPTPATPPTAPRAPRPPKAPTR